jgi:uncharacterized membrane protein
MKASLDLALGVGAVALALLLVLLEAPAVLRFPFGLLAILFAPGYVASLALFARRTDLSPSERLVLGLGLSVVLVSLCGLLLNYTPWGIRPWSMGSALLMVTLLLAGVVLLRRRGLGSEAFWPNLEMRPFHYLGTAGLLAGLGLLFWVTQPAQRYSEFYLANNEKNMLSYPSRLVPGAALSLTLGVRNHEGSPQAYSVRALFDPNAPVIQIPALEPGQSWQRTLNFKAPKAEGRTRLGFELYRKNDERPYRSLYLVVQLDPGNRPTPEREELEPKPTP